MARTSISRRSFLLTGTGALALASGRYAHAAVTRRRFRFALWNDVHVRDMAVPGRPPGYPRANEKAQWLLDCAQGSQGIEVPNFVLSAGDIVDGEIPDMIQDFTWLARNILQDLDVPFLPCLGNHENGQGEGQPETYKAYDECFGAEWRNYVFTVAGVGFTVVDTSGAHRPPDDVTAARSAFVERAFERLAGMPVIVVTHVPLVAMRDEEVLKKSFGFSSWRLVDPRMLEIVESHRDRVIAVLSGHLHLTGAREVNGILHVTSTGTASYPSTFAAVDVYDDHVDIRMHEAPDTLQDRSADIHGKPRYDIDYVDAEHATHEAYVRGNPAEREMTLQLKGAQCPVQARHAGLQVYHETKPGEWMFIECPRG